jgi:type VI protein secretion system component Hcp
MADTISIIVNSGGQKVTFDLSSFSQGLENTVSLNSTGGGAGKPVQLPTMISFQLDSTLPDFILLAFEGKHFDTVEVDFAKTAATGAKPQLYYKVVMSEVFITNIAYSAAGSVPVVEASLVYEKAQFSSYLANGGLSESHSIDFTKNIGS